MDSGIVAEFENRLLDIYEHAQKAFDAVFELPKLSFERMGLKAGVAYFLRNEIKINPDYFAATTNDIAAQAYVDADNNPCNGGLTLQGACANGNNTFNLTYTGLTPGNQLYIRIWDFNCNSLTGEDFSISVTSNNDVALTAAVNGTTVSLACGESIHFTDDGGTGANYSNHAPRTVTFCVPGGKALIPNPNKK